VAETVRDLLLDRRDDQSTGLVFEDRRWTWAESVQASLDVAAVLQSLRDPERPFHVGALLDNVPEMHLLISAAALDSSVLVGLNNTRRGEGLAADVRKAHCQIIITESRYVDLLDGLDLDGARVLDIDSPEWAKLLVEQQGADVPDYNPTPEDLMMLIFTSGTSGDPKAVRITDFKVFIPGIMLQDRFGLTGDDVTYLSMPLFHSNAIMGGWAPAVAGGTAIALTRKFSASGFLPDVRKYGVTYTNYVGKPLTYIMATPALPDDADNTLRIVFGNEAAERDIAAFSERFGCVVVDS
jgi:fatty-acyl-CoA synthase